MNKMSVVTMVWIASAAVALATLALVLVLVRITRGSAPAVRRVLVVGYLLLGVFVSPWAVARLAAVLARSAGVVSVPRGMDLFVHAGEIPLQAPVVVSAIVGIVCIANLRNREGGRAA